MTPHHHLSFQRQSTCLFAPSTRGSNYAVVIIRHNGFIKYITFDNISYIAIQFIFRSLRLEPAPADWLRYQAANDHSARNARFPRSDVTSGFFTRLAVLTWAGARTDAEELHGRADHRNLAGSGSQARRAVRSVAAPTTKAASAAAE